MNAAERKAALDRLQNFAKQQRKAEHEADRNSLDRAADIMALYDDVDENGRRRWALEMDPPTTRRRSGRPVDPESFSRFTKWLGEYVPGVSRRAYQLRDAHEIRSTYLNRVQISPTGERELRPLKWLVKNDHPEAIADVWTQAVELAGGKPPDSPTVRKALADWKKEHVPKQRKRAASRTPTGPQAHRLELERLARQLMEEDPQQFLLGFKHIEEVASKRFARKNAA